MKRKLLLVFSGIFLTTTGFFIGQNFNNTSKTSFIESRHQGEYKYINPLLECDAASFSQNVALDHLKKNTIDTIDKLKKTNKISLASVYYRDLNEGPWTGINEKEDFSPASLVKVPLMIAYFKAAETNPDILKQIIPVDPTYVNEQSIIPIVTLSPDQEYTVDELIARMIIYSDNQAYELLQKNIDNNIIVHTYTDLGIDITKAYTDPYSNFISVKSYAAFFRVLYNASYLNQQFSEKALNLLSQIKYADGLVKGINNPQIIVSHKFGERTYLETGEKQLHDCGIVYVPDNPYLVCIMTRGNDFSKLSFSIAEISKTIYQSDR